jgi:hypothetical protein
MSSTTIDTDPTRTVPEVWTDADLVELFEHARYLGQNGNPGGFVLTVDLFPFVGIEVDGGRALKPYDEWDYDGIRAWVAANPDDVRLAWQRVVRRVW